MKEDTEFRADMRKLAYGCGTVIGLLFVAGAAIVGVVALAIVAVRWALH